MITTTTKKIDGRDFTVTVSDTYLIRKVGTNEVYSEAWDLPDSGFEYEETDQVNYPETKDFGASWADQSNLQSYLHTLEFPPFQRYLIY